MAETIEPPKIITNAKDSMAAIIDVVTTVYNLKKTDPNTPFTALLYYKFNTEADADHWIGNFTKILNHMWSNKLKYTQPLAYRFVSKENTRDILDVFISETEDMVDMCIKMRYRNP